MLLARVLTGLALIGSVYFLVFYGPFFLFFLVVAGVIFFSLGEYWNLVTPKGYFSLKAAASLLSLGIVLLAYQGSYLQMLNLLALGTIGLAALGLINYEEPEEGLVQVGLTLMGVLYVGLLLSFLVLLRKEPFGPQVVFLVFLLTWSQDVAAFFGGRFLGQRKLCPRISPGKTVEGFLAGLLLCAGVAAGSRSFLVPDLSLSARLFLGIGLAVVGPLGDLFESMLKRRAGAKDSGQVFPGHGGLLDRLDSLTFGAPFAYFYLRIVWPSG